MHISKMRKLYTICAVLTSCHAILSQSVTQQKWHKRTLQQLNIFGGKRAVLSEFPHVVALGYGGPENPYWNCGGILISDNFVLTAAHCLYSREDGPVTFVRAGTTVLSKPTSSSRDYKVSEAIPHPNYEHPKMYHDIALLRLNTSVTLSPQIRIARLDAGLNKNHTEFTAIGWGSLTQDRNLSDNLMKVDLVSYNHETCKEHYGQQERELPQGIREDSMICAGGSKGQQKDTCFGDSGGPLQIFDGQDIIVGVTSFGKVCATPHVPGIYSRVSYYITWIKENIRK